MTRVRGRGWRCALALLLCSSAQAAEPYLDRSLESEGLSLRVRIEPEPTEGSQTGVGPRRGIAAAAAPKAGDTVRLSIDIERLADGEALSNLGIGAWLDRETSVMSGAVPACGQRVSAILGGGLMQRPLVDLTGYYVLTLDAEGSVSALDPAVQFAGRTSLYAAVQLGGVPFDWVKSGDDRWLFVALPERRQVAVVDLQTFKIRQRIDLSGKPTRLALQPDGQVLWVAQRGEAGGEGERIDLIAVGDGRRVGGMALAPGHHEIAFSDEGRYGYVSSRDTGAVAVIDNASGQRLREVELGGQLLSLAYLPGQSSLWAIDGERGVVHRLNAQGAQIDRIALEPGLGPARATPDGRYVLIVNPSQHRLHVLDAADGAVLHSPTISGRPYDLFFSRNYVYVRSLDIEQLAMIGLSSLGDAPVLQYIPVGAKGIGATPALPVASSMSENMEGAGAFIAAPGERTVYHYMEGMNAPDSGIRTYGHTPLAVAISRRGLRETGRGRYTTSFKVPSQGRMVLALATESPRVRECLAWTVAAGAPAKEAAWSLQWLEQPAGGVRRGQAVEFLVRLSAARGAQVPDPARFSAWVVSGGGGIAQQWPLLPTARAGEYRISGRVDAPGGYYVHVRDAAGSATRLSALPASLIVE
ncbi:PQQ-binding-like beta-propeller repeat protein [Lysobacter sp. Root604]|uniref:YncE family protein n=1 Tax=Lysobacter sp. Root604 TaxID=1736568 RepID=UPI000A86CE88|nr:PQQ-binding-like beta-propeller repeat protein [Lysobacter sp. Root604]